MKIALFLPNWLGDLVMATPTIRAIRQHFGRNARIVGILRPNLAGVLAGTGWLDAEWPFDPHARKPAISNWSLLRQIRSERPDLVVMLTNSLRPAMLSWLGRVPRRIGYDRGGRGLLLTTRVPVERRAGRIVPTPMVDYYLKLSEAVVGVESRELRVEGQGDSGSRLSTLNSQLSFSRRLELAVTDADREAARSVWQNLGLRDDGRVVALNSSGAYGSAKLWPREHFAQLARRVADELDHDVLVICGPVEREIARDIARLADRDRVFSLVDQRLGLSTTKGCLARCRLAVSTDSGPRHVAAALGKPVITLLGPTLPVWIENPAVAGVHLQVDLECTGCGRRVCPLGHHRCMRELSVETVYQQVARMLQYDRGNHREMIA